MTGQIPADWEQTFATLCEQNRDRLLRWVVGIFGARDAEDITQEAFIRLYLRPEVLIDLPDPQPWLAVVARNVGRDIARRHGPQRIAPLGVWDGVADAASVHDLVVARDEAQVLEAALWRLSPRDRALIGLRHVQQVSVSAIAALLGLSHNTARQHLFRARKRLAKAFVDLGGDPRSVCAVAPTLRPAQPARAADRRPFVFPGHTGPMVTAVVFDWGGTLTRYVHVDPVAAWSAAARCLAPTKAADLCGQLARAEAALWRAVHDDARSGSVATLIQSVTTELGVTVPASLLEEAGARCLRSWEPHVTHRTDAADTLRALRGRGLKIGLLSNTVWPGAFHDELLRRDGLSDLIDSRHYTSEQARMKPHPDAFAGVLRDLGVDDPHTAVFVGDRLFDDIFGAQRAGLRTVHMPNAFVPPYDVQPDARIGSLTQLLDVIERWTRHGDARGVPQPA